MISQFAIDAINDLQKEGLSPTPADIIRLNALALRCQNGEHAAEYLALPRTAYLGQLVFREPTLGHAEWIDRVVAHCESNYSTVLAVNAFALTRTPDVLPDPDDIRALRKQIDAFTKKDLHPFTLRQIMAAVDYAINGCDPSAHESPVIKKDHDDTDDPASDLIEKSTHIGVLYQSLSIGLGLSLADLRSMTPAAILSVQEMAFARLGINVAKFAKTRRLGEFYDTVAEIKKRLMAEREISEQLKKD